MATVKVTTFAAFADAVAVQGDTVEVMNDLDIAAEYPNGYTSSLNIMCAQINGNGHAIKNIRETDGDADALFQFGVDGQSIYEDDASKYTEINRLHFRNCTPKKIAIMNGNWYQATFNNCYFQFSGDSMVEIAAALYNYSAVSALCFVGCWFDIEIGANLLWLFTGHTNNNTRLEFVNTVFRITDGGTNSGKLETPFLDIYSMLRCAVLGEFDTKCFKSANLDLLGFKSPSAPNVLNSYFNPDITNTDGRTIELDMSVANGYSYPHQKIAVNSDKFASGITITDDHGQPAINTDAQMKAGRGLDIPENPSDTEWHLDPAYNNGYPYFNFAVPELQALWAYNPVATPKLFAGSDAVTELYLGSEPVVRAYLGDDVIA
jgi:hypothetical protein